MEKLTKAQRSHIMAAIHGQNTRPEMIVRRYLFSHGFRYRVNNPRLPGHPDIVLRKYRTCIFVNGCFWHGHDCGEFRPPKTNTAFWMTKIERNKTRDKREQEELAQRGWHVITVWECELKKNKRAQTLSGLVYTLNHIRLKDMETMFPLQKDYKPQCDHTPIAAEEDRTALYGKTHATQDDE